MHRFQGSAAFLKAAREQVYTCRYNPGYFCVLVKLLNKFYTHFLCLKVSALTKINQSDEVTVAPVISLCIHTTIVDYSNIISWYQICNPVQDLKVVYKYQLDWIVLEVSKLLATLYNIPKGR